MKNKSGYQSEPPRTRPGKKFPGGKILRKRMERLMRRIHGIQPGNCRRPDRINSREDTTPWGSFGLTRPGSMA